MIRDLIHGAAPLPWKAVRSRGRWTKVICADGMSMEDATFLESDGIMLGVMQAMAPEFLDYVEKASEKGGAEAKALIARFWQEVADLKAGP